MSGHSKWATTKRAKAVTDAKRSAVFTKLANLITIAAKEKGGDVNINFSLRLAVERARAANMPKDNIERSIKRGTGELAGAVIEELYYEGFGPANSQFVIKCLTDSKNRTASSIRHHFSKFGGSMGTVGWNFEQKGVIRVSKESLSKISFDELELELIEAGADDILNEEEGVTVYTKVADLQTVKNYFDNKNISVESAQIEYVAKEELALNEEDVKKVEDFIEALEEDEDVNDYYHNISNV
ncbi:MAG: transcriptional regulator [Parcubacteria group bacterium GW2011_GWE2_39_37]|uniref:Probable transcriptional regulatory protein UT64_C0003G0011 n=1 Tax=Candidatus Falkowbacteria bacterium GW2011_GWF2_39_8 TaxID=1618642 RepID=A0A0G0SGF4_9BACT|nr:MAG: transcriptional regulator [Parcubacteria group bacterium GW2011_GWE2_39_37]KKR33790.1 MAG: transcriptional regulator [Candidatus Falkowbacteria bacterium GW2011_GWF2_39_8]